MISVLCHSHFFPWGTGCSWPVVISLTLTHIRYMSHSCWEQKKICLLKMLMCNVWKSIKPLGKEISSLSSACSKNMSHLLIALNVHQSTHPSNPCTNGKNSRWKLGFLTFYAVCLITIEPTTPHTPFLLQLWLHGLSQHLNQWLLTRLCFVESLPLQSMIWTSLSTSNTSMGMDLRLWCKWAQGARS